jgi:hypothetical protein
MLKQILAVLAYMIAPAVFKNGHPKMMGDFSSPHVSITIKSAGTYELPTHTHISSRIPLV